MAYSVLAVDDSSLNHKIIKKIVTGRYDLFSALSGRECIDFLEESDNALPDLILMDVAMPDMDGYEACTEIKNNPKWSHIPVLFLSGRCGVEEKLKGYEVGGDEYITKPFDASELLIKIDHHMQSRVNEVALTNRIRQVETLANTAQKDASLMMVVVDFMRSSFGIRNLDRFGRALMSAVQELGVSSVLAIRNNKQELFYFASKGGEVRPLEQELLKQVMESGQGIDAGKRLAVSQENVSVLALDMSSDSESRTVCAAQLITLMSAAQARLENLFNELEIKRQRDILALLVDRTSGMVKSMNGKVEMVNKESGEMIEHHVDRLIKLVDDLNLNEFQEESVRTESDRLISSFTDLHRDAIKIDSEFDAMIRELSLFDKFNSR
jgi:CheY-like chemotaxis protein